MGGLFFQLLPVRGWSAAICPNIHYYQSLAFPGVVRQIFRLALVNDLIL